MHRLHLPHARDGEETVRVEGEALHHLRVLRLSVGAPLEVFDGKGRAWPAQLVQLEVSHALLRLGPGRTSLVGRSISLVQALPKAEKMEFVLQKGTELGAHAFYPALSERSLIRLGEEAAEARRARWQRIAEEAARQCGRADVPRVFAVQPLGLAVQALPPETRVLVLDEAETRLRLNAGAAADAHAPLALVVGPEGGLARAEVEALQALGAVPVSLGPLVLRTETAALAALAVLRHREGLLG